MPNLPGLLHSNTLATHHWQLVTFLIVNSNLAEISSKIDNRIEIGWIGGTALAPILFISRVTKESRQMVEYHLVTNWHFKAPIESVWEELIDVKSWPSWWSCWRKADFHDPVSVAQLGTIVDNEVRGKLPYSLRFSNEITNLQPPHLMEVKSSGDLEGAGKTVLERRDDGTAVTIYWDIETANPVFNLLGKLSFVRDMIEQNHEYVMDDGYRSLKQRLEQKQFPKEQPA